ncbi:hypothetical protein JOQ06_016520 [Pogonophryne albipinna]|uniref:Uncharacterized protein n=1 Tax=Pogonophryne albipinna TaxID=1090488 RepID=A0AAD6F4C4_9TELE|nr:hypothetical protein JOQ06_016520 [Pogonophryne albipinna]
MESFEFVVMTVIQGKVLETVNIVSQALQRKDVDLLQATVLGNTTDTLAQLRGEFDGLKAHAQDLASSWGVHSLFKDRRARRTKRHFSELCEDQRLQDPGEHFRVAVFYANIDIVVAQLKNRFVGMSEVAQRFSFLLPRKLLRATDKDLSESASALSGQYKDDLSAEFPFQILSLRNALRPTIKKIERGTIKDLAQTLLIENQSILPSIPDYIVGYCDYLQYIVGYCDYLQYIVGYCDYLQYIVGYCDRLQYIDGYCDRLQYIDGYCDRLQYIDGYCDRLQYIDGYCDRLQYIASTVH